MGVAPAVVAAPAADGAEDAGAAAASTGTTTVAADPAAVSAPLTAIGTSAVAESPAAVAAAVCLPKMASRSRMALPHRAHWRRRCLCCVSSDWFDSTLLSVVSACSLTVR